MTPLKRPFFYAALHPRTQCAALRGARAAYSRAPAKKSQSSRENTTRPPNRVLPRAAPRVYAAVPPPYRGGAARGSSARRGACTAAAVGHHKPKGEPRS